MTNLDFLLKNPDFLLKSPDLIKQHERPEISARQYFETYLPQLSAGELKPLECTLQAGELIYIPQGWWHAVLNLGPTIAYTETYVGAADGSANGAAAQVIGELMKRAPMTWNYDGSTAST